MTGKKGIKIWLKRIRRRLLYGDRYSALTYARRLNRMGARIDESIAMAVPESVRLDETTPYLLEIGKNVYMAEGIRIMTHDASWLVMKGEDGVIRGNIGPVKIGNNVFLGIDSVVLCNTTICDNVIIGAGAIVSTSIHKPGVYAGNPARLVIPLEEMKGIRESRQIKDAYVIAKQYYERYRTKPPKELFNEYFWIFEERREEMLCKDYKTQMELCGNYVQSLEAFLNSQPDFQGYDEFWEWCRKKLEKDKKRMEKNYGNSKTLSNHERLQ